MSYAKSWEKEVAGGRISEYKVSEARACPDGLKKWCFVLFYCMSSFSPDGATAIITILLMWKLRHREVEGIAGVELLTIA